MYRELGGGLTGLPAGAVGIFEKSFGLSSIFQVRLHLLNHRVGVWPRGWGGCLLHMLVGGRADRFGWWPLPLTGRNREDTQHPRRQTDCQMCHGMKKRYVTASERSRPHRDLAPSRHQSQDISCATARPTFALSLPYRTRPMTGVRASCSTVIGVNRFRCKSDLHTRPAFRHGCRQ